MQNFSENVRETTDTNFGWHLKATNLIEPGDVILEERPLIVSAHWDYERMKCSNCFRNSFVMCKRCHFFPLCLDCTTHDEFDCDFMIKATKSRNDPNQPGTSSNSVGVSRDLLVKDYSIYAVLKLLLLMENEKTRVCCDNILPPIVDLSDDYRASEAFQEHEERVVMPLLLSGILGYFQNVIKKRGAEIDAEFLHELCFLIDANAFEVNSKDTDDSLKAVYTTGTRIPHNCTPNTVISFDEKFKMRIYAAMPIQSGEIIFNCYVNPLMGTSQRQLQLRISRSTACHCPRCLDPTEMGTHMSSLKCQACSTGLMLCKMPIYNGIWKCNSCDCVMESNDVHKLLAEIADQMANANGELGAYERLLRNYESQFHPHHFIIVDIKQNIASLLGLMLSNPYGQLDRSLLERKMEINEDILPLVKTIQPGLSKLYTVALYDYMISFMEMAELKYGEKEIPKEEYILSLQRANGMIQEVVTMLSYEPIESPEGHLAQRILMEKKQIEQSLQSASIEEIH